ncbi:MAG: hypothetical protein ACRELV_16410 [Longimicrobiales bacterium]
MADVNAKVMSMVEDEIRKNASVSTESLYEKAKKLDKGIDQLSARQFNARYPLQVKRKLAPKRRRRARTAQKSTRRRGRAAASANGSRAEIRQILLQFAKELSASEDASHIVTVIGEIDKYVDRIEKVKA